jgi:hypothetical protein
MFLESYLKQHGVRDLEHLQNMIDSGSVGEIRLPEKPIDSAPYLSRVAVDLIDAITFASRKKLGYFGDGANRIYPCIPLPDKLHEGNLPNLDDYIELIKKLDILNRRAVVMEWSHLRDASPWVTAGGTLKLLPIWTLVISRYLDSARRTVDNPRGSVVEKLTTDSVTAQSLLDALDCFKRSSDRVQHWIAELASKLFQD